MSHEDHSATCRQGGCLCSAIRYDVAAAPVMAGLCYCESCRKLSGAGHAFHVAVPAAALTVHGEPKDYHWTADSGGQVTSSFCPACGSPLFGRSSNMPGLVTLRVASLDDPAAFTPQMAVYAKRLLPWDHLDPGLPAFEAMPPMPGA